MIHIISIIILLLSYSCKQGSNKSPGGKLAPNSIAKKSEQKSSSQSGIEGVDFKPIEIHQSQIVSNSSSEEARDFLKSSFDLIFNIIPQSIERQRKYEEEKIDQCVQELLTERPKFEKKTFKIEMDIKPLEECNAKEATLFNHDERDFQMFIASMPNMSKSAIDEARAKFMAIRQTFPRTVVNSREQRLKWLQYDKEPANKINLDKAMFTVVAHDLPVFFAYARNTTSISTKINKKTGAQEQTTDQMVVSKRDGTPCQLERSHNSSYSYAGGCSFGHIVHNIPSNPGNLSSWIHLKEGTIKLNTDSPIQQFTHIKADIIFNDWQGFYEYQAGKTKWRLESSAGQVISSEK